MEGDIQGVRIEPRILKFLNTVPGSMYTLTITVKNVTEKVRSVRFYGPDNKKNFNLKVKNPEKPLAPGLCLPATMEYIATKEAELTDRLVLTVDGEIIEVPIFTYLPCPLLELPSDVNFGTVLADNKVLNKEILLINSGAKAGEFKITYNGNKHISIIPSCGSVPPNSGQIIKVELLTNVAEKIDETALVELEGLQPNQLRILCDICKPLIEVLSLKDEQPLRCISFGHTYYGTDCTEWALLYNNGPEPLSFVAIIDQDAVAQEMGVDLTQPTTVALEEENDSTPRSGNINAINSIITAVPNQGILQPHQKMPIFFRFSPRWNIAKMGWKCQVIPPPRKDFVLFVRFEMAGSSKGFTTDTIVKKSSNGLASGPFAEVGLTGTALPVLLDISPSDSLDFGPCTVGECVDVLCTIRNESALLPALFQFRRIAHFSTKPPNGKIAPGHTQDVVLSFAPKQVGTFKPKLLLDVLGQVADSHNPILTTLQVISTLATQVSGHSDPVTVVPKPRFNPGLTPYISNEVGMYVETTFASLDSEGPRNAVAGSTRVRLHRISRPKSLDLDDRRARVAFPNDRPHSVRPSERHQSFLTPFTHMERHTYVDPDYAYTDDETLTRRTHRSTYVEHLHFIQDLKQKRRRKREYSLTANDTDIGLKPAAGILPKPLKLKEINSASPAPSSPNARWKLLTTRELVEAQKETISKPVEEGLNAVPTTDKEKTDCKKYLSPLQLHQILVGPPAIVFGKVCQRSVSQKELNIVNNLQDYILVEATIDSRELRQSSPLSQVVPPRSRAVIPIIFESSTKGTFQRSLMYTINGHHHNHVTVVAEVVAVGLELSTNGLVLKPTLGLPADAGFRGVITLHNKLNLPAEFTWSPDIDERGTAFSIRPATGTVNANSSLDCEVVWHPSYLAPENGSFTLIVHGGESLKLECMAELGPTSVCFVDQRVSFGNVPVNLTTTKTIMLRNTGLNHAYFQVLDPNPIPSLTVAPLHGVVPVGGVTELYVSLTPEAVLKFDTRVQVAIKGSYTQDMRMGGIVQPPIVDVNVSSFLFGGVYCGGKSSIPFKVTNKGNTRCKMEFDLTRYKDFSVTFPGCQTSEDYNYQLMNPGMSTVSLGPSEIVKGQLTFAPVEVAAYDFVMPVFINHLGAPTPASTPFPPTPAEAHKNRRRHTVSPHTQPFLVETPSKHVVATALRQPLQICHTDIKFSMPYAIRNMSCGLRKTTVLVNNTQEVLKWGLDLRNASKALEAGIIKFVHSSGVPFISSGPSKGIEGQLDPGKVIAISIVFCPKEPGVYECQVPVVIKEKWNEPYQMLTITGCLQEPAINFDPPGVCLTPVPLLTEVSCEFNILASQYTTTSQLTVECPSVECEDGTTISPLQVFFLHSSEIPVCSGTDGFPDMCRLPCKVTFRTSKPVSFTKPIIFHDDQGHSFPMAITATADNCLLTCYPFLALHRVDHQIVREKQQDSCSRLRRYQKGTEQASSDDRVVIIPVNSPNRSVSRPSTSATTSTFQVASSFEHSTSASESTRSTPGPREGAMNKPPSGSDLNSRQQREVASRLGSAIFPDEDSEEGIFHVEVLLAVQRWFSANGWQGGPFPISIPETLRNGFASKESEGSVGSRASAKKESKTVYDMIAHLSGQPLPGIPINSPLPADPMERVKQIYWQHTTLLTFLRCQGGCVAAIRPEYLLSASDFVIWQQLQRQVKKELQQQGKMDEASKIRIDDYMEDDVFEAVSKRAWTDVLLQILKTLVLASVTLRSYKALPLVEKDKPLPPVSSELLASNIYSLNERILLAWLNHYYEAYRQKVWQNCSKGGVPPSRWIVNYDFDLLDGLVFGALLGAHMPFLIETHLKGMYTHPTTAEQCLHNAIKVVNAMRYAGVDYDVQAIDITDPNPIMMLLLVAHLYQILPSYLPKATVEFSGALHSTVTRQVKITNPTHKPMTYQVLLAGRSARDFNIPRGPLVVVGSRQAISLSVEFTSRFLQQAEAVLVLVSTHQGSSVTSILTFNLRSQINSFIPAKDSALTDKVTVHTESPLYEMQRVMLNVKNPFDEEGMFRVVLIESGGDLLEASMSKTLIKMKEKKLTKIQSKTNHGQVNSETSHSPSPPKVSSNQDLIPVQNGGDSPRLSAFFTDIKSVYLKQNSSVEVEVDFLPFSLGHYQCCVVFINETVGEFLYSIEAKATMPLPSALPYVPSPHSTRVSSAAVAGIGDEPLGADDRVVYWKCEAGRKLQEKLFIPVTNVPRERALLTAAQQQKIKRSTLLHTTYTVECNSENFKFPDTIHISSGLEGRSRRAPSNAKLPRGVNADDGVVELPVEFQAQDPGLYPCQIILRSVHDVRIYCIECSVTPEGKTFELAFCTPASEMIMQEIPIVNGSSHDWVLTAEISGECFHGPSSLLAKAYQKTLYPLVFRPLVEGTVKGKLTLKNSDDGIEHVFCLVGKGQKPRPKDSIKLKMEANEVLTYTIKVPNTTRKKLLFKVETDLPFLEGPRTVVVLPKCTTDYTLTLSPNQRGEYLGVISFTAGENPPGEIDSDGDDIPQEDVQEYQGYHIWFRIEVTVRPPPPQRVIPVLCHCNEKMLVEVIVRNPTPEDITITATIEGKDLTGPSSISVGAGEKDVFTVKYAPQVVGKSKGSITFFNNLVGEFWYQLELEVLPPAPTILPHMTCQLGRWTEQRIVLKNPTNDTLELTPTVSNANNFSLQFDSERPIVLRPRGTIALPLFFMPSALGQADHSTKIIFRSQQLGEWTFLASGTGLLPEPQDPVRVSSATGGNSTFIIPFRNPLDTAVLATVTLQDVEEQAVAPAPTTEAAIPAPSAATTPAAAPPPAPLTTPAPPTTPAPLTTPAPPTTPAPLTTPAPPTTPAPLTTPAPPTTPAQATAPTPTPALGPAARSTEATPLANKQSAEKSPFSLLLKGSKGSICVGPKSTLDIPISFAPREMRRHESLCTVTVTPEDGKPWQHLPEDALGYSLSQKASGGVQEIHWIYPVYGVPEAKPVKETYIAQVECRARDTVEHLVEVSLSGVVACAAGQHKSPGSRGKTVSARSKSASESVVVGETLATADEFTFELVGTSSEMNYALAKTVSVMLVKQERETLTGLVKLGFNITFNPFKPMNCVAHLNVMGSLGGIWRFPIRFVASEPPADDIINIEATGIGKASFIGFRLHSQTEDPTPFTAYFDSDSDSQEFTVDPQTGDLLPADVEGTLFTISFTPSAYGKLHKAKLIIQTSDMQWSYVIQGVLPEYVPPRGHSSAPIAGPHPDPRHRKKPLNYVLENTRLLTTAVSSPVKGAPLVKITQVK